MRRCLHLNQRRYGRVSQDGRAVVEHRCLDCGETLRIGRVGDAQAPRGLSGGEA